MWSMILLMSRLPGSHSMSAGRRSEKLGYQQSTICWQALRLVPTERSDCRLGRSATCVKGSFLLKQQHSEIFIDAKKFVDFCDYSQYRQFTQFVNGMCQDTVSHYGRYVGQLLTGYYCCSCRRLKFMWEVCRQDTTKQIITAWTVTTTQ